MLFTYRNNTSTKNCSDLISWHCMQAEGMQMGPTYATFFFQLSFASTGRLSDGIPRRSYRYTFRSYAWFPGLPLKKNSRPGIPLTLFNHPEIVYAGITGIKYSHSVFNWTLLSHDDSVGCDLRANQFLRLLSLLPAQHLRLLYPRWLALGPQRVAQGDVIQHQILVVTVYSTRS